MEIYLDNSSTTKPYSQVVEKYANLMELSYGNPSSLHRKGLEAEGIIKSARKKIAKIMNCSDGEIYFNSGGTEGDNTCILGAALKKIREGKKILVSSVEHPAVLEPANKLERMGFKVVYLPVTNSGEIDLEAFKNSLSDDVTLISVMTVNNETGNIPRLREIADIKLNFEKKTGKKILFHTDYVQGLGKVKLDLKREEYIDMLTTSAHKIHGPKGVGFMYLKKGVTINPFMIGGGQENHFRSGTENVPGIGSFSIALDLAYGDFDKRLEHINRVREYLLKGIEENLKDVKINSPKDKICPSVLNVSFLGTRGEVILHSLENEGIYVSTGSACSSNKAKKGSHVLKAMGLKDNEIEGAIRFSFSEFNTLNEMDFVLDKLITVVNRFRKLGTFR